MSSNVSSDTNFVASATPVTSQAATAAAASATTIVSAVSTFIASSKESAASAQPNKRAFKATEKDIAHPIKIGAASKVPTQIWHYIMTFFKEEEWAKFTKLHPLFVRIDDKSAKQWQKFAALQGYDTVKSKEELKKLRTEINASALKHLFKIPMIENYITDCDGPLRGESLENGRKAFAKEYERISAIRTHLESITNLHEQTLAIEQAIKDEYFVPLAEVSFEINADQFKSQHEKLNAADPSITNSKPKGITPLSRSQAEKMLDFASLPTKAYRINKAIVSKMKGLIQDPAISIQCKKEIIKMYERTWIFSTFDSDDICAVLNYCLEFWNFELIEFFLHSWKGNKKLEDVLLLKLNNVWTPSYDELGMSIKERAAKGLKANFEDEEKLKNYLRITLKMFPGFVDRGFANDWHPDSPGINALKEILAPIVKEIEQEIAKESTAAMPMTTATTAAAASASTSAAASAGSLDEID